MDYGMPGSPVLHCLPRSWLRFMSFESVMLSNHLILCRPLLLLPSIFPSTRVFPDDLGLYIGWPKYWSFSFSISPSSEHSGLTSFRIVWFDLLAVQGTLKSLLQHHSLKPSILGHSAFFMVQLSHLYIYIDVCVCVCVCVYACHILKSIHLLMDTYCFNVLAVVNNAAMNMRGTCIFLS